MIGGIIFISISSPPASLFYSSLPSQSFIGIRLSGTNGAALSSLVIVDGTNAFIGDNYTRGSFIAATAASHLLCGSWTRNNEVTAVQRCASD
ncbi:hypothetical protein PM082_004799 [Marasmius tenuissimus]|nr:hypothetical protein PM082_004799 [Marasmius tenuissimus]